MPTVRQPSSAATVAMMIGSSSIEPGGQAEDPLAEHRLGGAHGDAGDLAELLDVAAQRDAVLGDPRPEDHERVLLDQLEEGVADRPEGAVGQTLHGSDDELDRTLEHALFA